MILVLEKNQINNFLEELKKKFEVFDIRKDILPPKQYFFPAREENFNLNKKTGHLLVQKSKKNFVVFGLNLEDLEAIIQLDNIMKKPRPDFFYFQKRNRTVIIGLIEHSIKVPPGGDIVLKKINPRQYKVLILTPQGRKISQNKFLKKVRNVKIKNYPVSPVKMKKLKEMLLDSEFLADAVSWSWKNDQKIWEELKELCVGCGVCTYVCPLCYCFSAEDRISIDNKECTRCRQWDACTLPNFAKVSGGHDFHPTLKERYYNWFYHKFVRGYKEYGRALCVACGQCKKYCPVKIDIEAWLAKIIKDYEKYLLTPKS